MANTSILAGLDLTKWKKDFLREYVRDSGFEPYMGDSPMDIIHTVNDLKTDGYTIRIPLIARLTGAGVVGNNTLGGNEEALGQFYQDVVWEFYRNAVALTKKEREKSGPEIMATVKPLLKEWASELIKYQIIDTFHTMSDGTTYSAAAAGVRNTFITNNADRVLFGKLRSNGSSNVMATALATLDLTDDRLDTSKGELAKRMARQANPHIRPFKTGTQGREYFVMFTHPDAFRDLKADTAMIAANRDARAREGDAMDRNPLFQDGDLIKDGIIYREIPEFKMARTTGTNNNTHLINAGAGGTVNVGVNFLCGAQSLAFANKQAPLPTEKAEDDYGFIKGLGVELAHGISKLRWNNNGAATNKDLGIVTVYTAVSDDQ